MRGSIFLCLSRTRSRFQRALIALKKCHLTIRSSRCWRPTSANSSLQSSTTCIRLSSGMTRSSKARSVSYSSSTLPFVTSRRTCSSSSVSACCYHRCPSQRRPWLCPYPPFSAVGACLGFERPSTAIRFRPWLAFLSV